MIGRGLHVTKTPTNGTLSKMTLPGIALTSFSIRVMPLSFSVYVVYVIIFAVTFNAYFVGIQLISQYAGNPSVGPQLIKLCGAWLQDHEEKV
jgi:hypothetical protein